MGADGLDEVKKDISLYHVAREVEGLVDLNKGTGHSRQLRLIKDICYIDSYNSNNSTLLPFNYPHLTISAKWIAINSF